MLGFGFGLGLGFGAQRVRIWDRISMMEVETAKGSG